MICEDLVLYQLGTNATTVTPSSIENVYEDSSCITPIIFFLPHSMYKQNWRKLNLKGIYREKMYYERRLLELLLLDSLKSKYCANFYYITSLYHIRTVFDCMLNEWCTLKIAAKSQTKNFYISSKFWAKNQMDHYFAIFISSYWPLWGGGGGHSNARLSLG